MTTLTEQEFLNEVLNRLQGCLEHVDNFDLECVYRMIKQDYREGVSVEDCAKATYYTEHVSPHFSERYACDRISEIMRKYRTNGRCK